MDPEPTVIRQNIEETRAGLTLKLETLENEVIGTVKGATEAVAETVESVKDSVESTVENVRDTVKETVQSVKESLDVKRQTREHPWGMVGATLFAGYTVGSFLPPVRRSRVAPAPDRRLAPPRRAVPLLAEPAYQAEVTAPPLPAEPPPPAKPSFLSRLLRQFEPEIQQLKGVAIGAAAGVVRDMLKAQMPPALVPHVEDVIHNVTARLGGTDIRGPILPESTPAA